MSNTIIDHLENYNVYITLDMLSYNLLDYEKHKYTFLMFLIFYNIKNKYYLRIEWPSWVFFILKKYINAKYTRVYSIIINNRYFLIHNFYTYI